MGEDKIIEKRIVERVEPRNTTTNVNIGPDGTTNVQESGDPVVEEHVVEEERVVEEHRKP